MSPQVFFGKGERPNDETAEDSKTVNKMKTAFKRKYQESYLNYGFIATGDSHSPSMRCIICGGWLSNETFKTTLPQGDQAPCIKRQAFGVFQKEICEHKGQKQLVMITTSSNVSALRASFLVVNIIAKVKKSFTLTEESILPVAKDNFHELLGEAAVQKMARVPLLASTETR